MFTMFSSFELVEKALAQVFDPSEPAIESSHSADHNIR